MPKDDDLVGQRSSSRFDVPESVIICFATHDGTAAGAGLSDRTLIFGRRHLQNVLTEYTRRSSMNTQLRAFERLWRPTGA